MNRAFDTAESWKVSLPTSTMLTYDLPSDRIAMHPLEERDASKLLVWRSSDVPIEHTKFRGIAPLLDDDSLLIVNQTRVIAARLYARKPTGGMVEVLITDPVAPSTDPAVVLAMNEASQWRCLIGGRNVHPGMELVGSDGSLMIRVLDRTSTEGIVELAWEGGSSLSEIIDRCGAVPLPPYIQREVERADEERYQTIYARDQGSVAAPTAGLHFTERVMQDIAGRGIDVARVTLHVGLGTFRPVEAGDLRDHVMHSERIIATDHEVQRMAEAANRGVTFTCVGTTSIRTMESLYLWGSRLLRDGDQGAVPVSIDQWDAFDPSLHVASRGESFARVSLWMQQHAMTSLHGSTQLMIAPGCMIRSTDRLITNFHQPGNTLLALIAGFVGTDNWRVIYDAALANDYRFLSYGDSSLLFRNEAT
ncbi:MAG: S-adenosylmethionine:tRNA ribosyltransferase-isomerase [Candidatus Kapabacteria bacterium]|nr:S-adenosylmethionine:tRNA ribosyltransferase-isomerase [Candidatus Kapabacteria bacterium]